MQGIAKSVLDLFAMIVSGAKNRVETAVYKCK
jgi:hypothetical protein